MIGLPNIFGGGGLVQDDACFCLRSNYKKRVGHVADSIESVKSVNGLGVRPPRISSTTIRRTDAGHPAPTWGIPVRTLGVRTAMAAAIEPDRQEEGEPK